MLNLNTAFAALADPRAARYLQSLGVTSAEFLPVHAFLDDSYLVDKGMRNYWGYNSIGSRASLSAFTVRQ